MSDNMIMPFFRCLERVARYLDINVAVCNALWPAKSDRHGSIQVVATPKDAPPDLCPQSVRIEPVPRNLSMEA